MAAARRGECERSERGGQESRRAMLGRTDHALTSLTESLTARPISPIGNWLRPFLGIESSPAFVRAPEGNGCAERFIRTVKENLLWLRRFETVEELRLAPADR